MQTPVIRWSDGYVSVSPFVPEFLFKKLTYWHRSIVWDDSQRKRVASGERRELYKLQTYVDPETNQPAQMLVTMPGFAFRVKQLLAGDGYPCQVLDCRTPPPQPDIAAAMSCLRPYQKEGVYVALKSGGGIVACPVGWGKTHAMAAIIRAFSHEQLKLRGTPTVVVAAPEKDITAKNYTVLQQALPDRDVGLVMSGHKKFSHDVQVITLNSLHLVDPSEVGLLLVDEVHAAATSVRTEDLLSMRLAVRYGFSATPIGRFDGADLVTEGLFGPVVYRRTYQQGVQDGALVPIKVYWLPSPEPDCGLDTYYAYSKREALYRHAVDRNTGQNKAIAQVIARTPDKHQLLCIMQHVDHMNRLAPLAGPAVTCVHAVTSASDLVTRKFHNILPVSPKERKAVYDGMNDGSIRKAMSTYVYKQGVDFPSLSVIVVAGGGGSNIIAEQIPGRESRNIGEEKQEAYLVDFYHPWDVMTDERGRKKPGPVLKDDNSRRKVYEDVGFEQNWITAVDQLPFVTGSTASQPANLVLDGNT